MSLQIAVAQNPAELDGTAARLAWLETQLAQLPAGTDLLLLPELFLCGYHIGDDIRTRAETADGAAARRIAALAAHYKTAIHYSYAELDGQKLYNASQCFDAKGQPLGAHRKLLPAPGFERNYFSEGQGCALFELKGFRVATLICFDAEFPESFRHVCELGADLVLVPTALAQQWAVVAEHLIPTRAFENGCFVAYANQAGRERGMRYYGGSCVVGCQGGVLARAGDAAELISARLELDDVQVARTRLPYLESRHALRL